MRRCGKRGQFSRWFVLVDGDGDVVGRHGRRGELEKLKAELERDRPCGEYRVVEEKWRGNRDEG